MSGLGFRYSHRSFNVNQEVEHYSQKRRINGCEAYEQIIKIRPEQKSIIASGFSETENVTAAQKLGAGKYIKKPYTLKALGLGIKEELKEPDEH